MPQGFCLSRMWRKNSMPREMRECRRRGCCDPVHRGRKRHNTQRSKVSMNFSQRAGNERNSKVLRKPAQPNGKEIPRWPPRQSLLTRRDRAGRHGKMVELRVGAKQKRVMQVFFSYDNSDRNFAKSLGDQLATRGLSPWIADIELLPGDNWAHSIG